MKGKIFKQILRQIFTALILCTFVLGTIPATAFAAADSSSGMTADTLLKEDAATKEEGKTTETKKDGLKSTETTKEDSKEKASTKDELKTTSTTENKLKSTVGKTESKKETTKSTETLKKATTSDKTETTTKTNTTKNEAITSDDEKKDADEKKADEKIRALNDDEDKTSAGNPVPQATDTPIEAKGGICVVLPTIGKSNTDSKAALVGDTLNAEIIATPNWSGKTTGEPWKEGDTPKLTIILKAKNESPDKNYYFDKTFDPKDFTIYDWKDPDKAATDFSNAGNEIANVTASVNTISNVTATFTLTFQKPKEAPAEPPACQHQNLKKTDEKAPTCTEDGNIEYWYCDSCKKYFKDEKATQEITKEDTVLKAAHDLKHIEAKDATCVSTGNKEYWYCKREACKKYFGDEKATNELTKKEGAKFPEGIETKEDPNNHELTHVDAKAATCQSTGNKEYWYCEPCEKYFEDEKATKELTKKEGAKFPEGIETKEDPNNHELTHVDAKAATCTTDGNKEYWYCKHGNSTNYFKDKDAKNKTSKTDVTITKTGHNYTASYNWSNDRKSCTVTFVCQNNKNHTYTTTATVTSSVTTNATCTEMGTTKYTAKVTLPATVTFNKQQTYTNTQSIKDIPKKEHSLVLKNAKNATCTLEGYTGDKVCTICNRTIVAGNKTNKVAHKYQNGKCTVCGATSNSIFNPKTGDNSRILLFTCILLLSVVGIAGVLIYNRRRRV